MEISSIEVNNAQAGRFDGLFPGLISALGTDRFESLFMALAREACRCEHLTIFAWNQHRAPSVLFAANNGPRCVAQQISQAYVSRYWRLDPVVRAANEPFKTKLIELDTSDIGDSAYRYDCYTSVGLSRRRSILHRLADGIVQLNAYSKKADRGPLHGLSELAPHLAWLLALVFKHRELTASSRPSFSDFFRRRLKGICPMLSERETDVCVAIANGLSSEAMSIEWGISINTVLSYRKRAYTRLNITSHNELMRLVLWAGA
jgi:DNA-binding CsgD family transcriptional regulator